jgi:hypothetical protein
MKMSVKAPNNPSRRASVAMATVVYRRSAVGDSTPCQQMVWLSCWNDMRR